MTSIKHQLRGWNAGMENIKHLLVSRLFTTLTVELYHGIFAVVGIHADNSHSAPLLKYSEESVAQDVANVILNRAQGTINN